MKFEESPVSIPHTSTLKLTFRTVFSLTPHFSMYAALIEEVDHRRLVHLVGELHQRSKMAGTQGQQPQGRLDWHADTHTKAGIHACLRRWDVAPSTLKEILQEQQRTVRKEFYPILRYYGIKPNAGPSTLAVGAWVECYARAPMGAEFGAYIGVGIVSRQCLERGNTLKIGLLDKSTDRGWQRWHIDNIAFKQQIELAEVCCKSIGPADIPAALCTRLTTLTQRFEAEKTLLRIYYPDG